MMTWRWYADKEDGQWVIRLRVTYNGQRYAMSHMMGPLDKPYVKQIKARMRWQLAVHVERLENLS